MERLSFKLAAVLGFQLALALVLWSFSSDHTAFRAKDPLLAFDPAKVDRIEIAENGASSVALVKEDGKWTIPSFASFPADGAKVTGFLTKLNALKRGGRWPRQPKPPSVSKWPATLMSARLCSKAAATR